MIRSTQRNIAMGRRTLVTLSFSALMFAQAPATKAAPSNKGPSQNWTQPKTPWGGPDLQGVWPATELIGVPVQRPANFGTRNVLTEEEFTQRQTQAKRTAESDAEEYAKEGAPGINPPSYWIERGKPNHMASLVVDPPDGRIPAMTAEAQKIAQ